MRLVLDTNVVVSALMYGGPPAKLWALAATGLVSVVTTEALAAELGEALAKPKFADRLRAARYTPQALVADYLALAGLVVAPRIHPVIRADPDDDEVLACALAARADAIVSGDGHLLALGEYRGIPILPVARAVALISSASWPAPPPGRQ